MSSLATRRPIRLPAALVLGLAIFSGAFVFFSNDYRIHEAPYRNDILTTEIKGTEPQGRDFSTGLRAARDLMNGHITPTGYPPLATLPYVPWVLLNGSGYIPLTEIMILVLLALVYFLLRESGTLARGEAAAVSIVLATAFYHSYWFQFDLERGNADILSTALVAIGLLTLDRRHGLVSMFWFSLATQWHLTPLLFAALLIPRHGIRRFLEFIAINTLLFLALGMNALRGYSSELRSRFTDEAGLHASHSLLNVLHQIGKPGLFVPLTTAGFILLALALTFSAKMKRTPGLTLVDIGIAGILCQLGLMVPPVSLDYRLGLQIVPFLLLITRLNSKSRPLNALRVGITIFIAAAIGYFSAAGIQHQGAVVIAAFIAYSALAAGALALESESGAESAVTSSMTQAEHTLAATEGIAESYRAVSDYFDRTARARSHWVKRNAGYNGELLNVLSQHAPPGNRILEIGCSTGTLLSRLKPSVGVGIDLSGRMIEEARRINPHLRFVQGYAETFRLNEKFDRILIADTVCFIRDLQAALENIRHVCTHETRVIITTYNYFWLPILRFLERTGFKMPLPASNWISRNEIANVLNLADFEIIKDGSSTLIPARIPLLAAFANRILAHLPGLRRLGLIQYVVARPLHLEARKEKTVSVIIPARNESGNIELIVNEIPDLGSGVEIIFVEGHSSDDTWAEIQAATARHPERKILALQQAGTGKWDAVRTGFAAATGDILMIFDADRTVPASDLVKFYEAIVSNRAEFVSGDRFVYPREEAAMPFLNVLGNRFFAGVFSWMLDQRIQDTLCGTKVMLRSTYNRLERVLPEFGGIDPFGDYDLILGAARLNLKFATVPIRYRSRTYGKSNISPWSDSLLLFRICWIAVRRLRFF